MVNHIVGLGGGGRRGEKKKEGGGEREEKGGRRKGGREREREGGKGKEREGGDKERERKGGDGRRFKEGRKKRGLVGGEVEIICHVENYSYLRCSIVSTGSKLFGPNQILSFQIMRGIDPWPSPSLTRDAVKRGIQNNGITFN